MGCKKCGGQRVFDNIVSDSSGELWHVPICYDCLFIERQTVTTVYDPITSLAYLELGFYLGKPPLPESPKSE